MDSCGIEVDRKVTSDDTPMHGDQFRIGVDGDTGLRKERPAPNGGGAGGGAPPG